MPSPDSTSAPSGAVLLLAAAAAVTTVGALGIEDLRPYGWHIATAGGVLLVPVLVCGRALWQWTDQTDRYWRPMLALAVVLRLAVLVGAAPSLSDDVYRYVWDGRQQLHGVNPYRHAPEADEVAELRDELWAKVNHKHVPTIYPPLAEGVFLLADAMSHTERAQRMVFVAFDVGLILALGALCKARGLPPARTALYALHPLPILEIAGQGHNDSLPLFFLVLALILHQRGNGSGSFAALAASTLSKFFAGAVAPLIALRQHPRTWIVFPVVIVLGYLPYAGAGMGLFGGLGTYAVHWEFNHSLFRGAFLLLRDMGMDDPRMAIKLVFALCGAGLLLVLCVRRTDPVPGAAILIGAAMLLSPTVHPWYVLWCLVLLPCVRSYGLLAWSVTALMSYHVMPRWAAEGVWREDLWVVAFEYVPVFALLAFDAWRANATRPASRLPAPSDPSSAGP